MSGVTSKMTALVEENQAYQLPSLGPLHLYKATSSPEEPRKLPQNLFFNKTAEAVADPPEQGGGNTTDILSKRIQALEGRLEQIHTRLLAQETSLKAHILVLEERVSAAERRLLQQQSQSSAPFVSSNKYAQQIDLNTLTKQRINHPTTHFNPLFKVYGTLQDRNFKQKGPASFNSKKDHQRVGRDVCTGSPNASSLDSQDVLLSLRARLSEAQCVLEQARTMALA